MGWTILPKIFGSSIDSAVSLTLPSQPRNSNISANSTLYEENFRVYSMTVAQGKRYDEQSRSRKSRETSPEMTQSWFCCVPNYRTMSTMLGRLTQQCQGRWRVIVKVWQNSDKCIFRTFITRFGKVVGRKNKRPKIAWDSPFTIFCQLGGYVSCKSW
jgi:hypothetical protein